MSQEIYVKEMPKCCGCCEFYSHNRYNEAYCPCLCMRLSYVDKYKDCPLKSLHEYKKELVAKVLDKVKFLITKYDLLKNYNSCAGYFMLDKIIEQIQKEFEK